MEHKIAIFVDIFIYISISLKNLKHQNPLIYS